MRLEGSAAIVTGGASGLGAATVRLFASRGVETTIWDRDADAGARVTHETGATFHAVDVRERAQIEAALVEIRNVRILVNCAGVGALSAPTGTPDERALRTFERVIAVNLTGTWLCSRLVAERMATNEPIDGERGIIIHTSSTLALEGQCGQTAYAASKAGVLGLVLPMARELAPHGIRCNAIAPGLFDTPMIAALPDAQRERLVTHVPFPNRLGIAAEFAHLVAAVCENTMLNGTTIRLDGAVRNPPS